MRVTSTSQTAQNQNGQSGNQNQLQVKQSQASSIPTTSKDQRAAAAQQQNSGGSGGEENRGANSATAASSLALTQAQYVQDQTTMASVSIAAPATVAVQSSQQPLQARSSNSGTSVKRSDNISQSSYPNGDISSDKPGHCGGWAKTSSTSTQPQQLTIGQTTSAFAAQHQLLGQSQRGRAASNSHNGGTETVVGTPTSTANTKEAPSINNKRATTNTRRSAASAAMSSNLLVQQETHSTAASQQAMGAQGASERTSGAQPASRVSTRASGRQTRQSEHRAVKDSSSCLQHHQQLSDTQLVAGGLHPPPSMTITTKPTTMQQSATEAQSLNTSSVDLLLLEEPPHTTTLLKPVKQSCSENNSYAVANSGNAAGAPGASSSMRTTRSKAKAANKQMDKTASKSGGPNKITDEAIPRIPSNGQPEQKAAARPPNTTHPQGNPKAKVEAEGATTPTLDKELNRMISANENHQNDDQIMMVEKIDEAPSSNITKQPSQQQAAAWQMAATIAAAEESKMQSPRSSCALNSSSIIAAVQGDKTANNQSFRINDSTDSLLENPLTTVIKQFQNLRTNAQLTGKNKPTIQQFLEKFEKEMQQLEDQYQAQQQAREEQMRLFEQHYGGKKPAGCGDLPGPKAAKASAMGGTASYMGASAMLGNDQHASGRSYTAAPVSAMMASAGVGAGPHQSTCDALMVQDTATLGPMPSSSLGAASFSNVNVGAIDQSNTSFNSAVHGPNNQAQSVFGGASCSEITHSEVYESFTFSQNSMLQFYPRQVRKILTRRKTSNSASTIMSELRDLKAPKHKLKMKKTMSKMQSLALCQMNMMQILLQKISRRSKVIRKQEKLVNDNLKRKRIYLEKERFDLMSVLRKSLEVTEQREQQLQSQQQTAGQIASTNAHQPPQQQVAQKNKTNRGGSELNSNCLSTSGTARYGGGSGGPTNNNTTTTNNVNICSQSIKGSSTAVPGPFGEENTSMDGASRKQTRLQSGAEHCLSVTADPVSYKGVHANMTVEGGSVKAQQATPEPPTKKIASSSNSQAVVQVATTGANNQNQNSVVVGSRHKEQTTNAMTADPAMMVVLDHSHQLQHPHHQLYLNEQAVAQSNNMLDAAGAALIGDGQMASIEGELMHHHAHPSHNGEQEQIFAPNSPLNSPCLLRTPPKNNQSSQVATAAANINDEIQDGQMTADQQHIIAANQLQPLSLTADGAAGQRKMQSTQGAKPRNSKRNRNNTSQHMLMVADHVMEDDIIVPQALDMGSVALGEAGSNYVIADLVSNQHPPSAPGGNFSVTIKKSGQSASQSQTEQKQQLQQSQNNNDSRQQLRKSRKTGSQQQKQACKKQDQEMAAELAMEDVAGQDQEQEQQDAMIDQQRHDSQLRRRGRGASGRAAAASSRGGTVGTKQLSPLSNNLIEHHPQQESHQQQQNATNGASSSSAVSAAAVSANQQQVQQFSHHQQHQSLHQAPHHPEEDEVDFFVTGLQHHHHPHQLPLNMVVGSHHHHSHAVHHHHLDEQGVEEVEDHVMQPPDHSHPHHNHHHHHFLVGSGSAAEVTGHHHQVVATHRQSSFPPDFIVKHHHNNGSSGSGSGNGGTNHHPQSGTSGHHHHHPHHAFQPLVPPGQLAELTMHHSKSVVLPPAAPNNPNRAHEDILDTLVDFAQVDFVDDDVASAGGAGAPHHHHHHPQGPEETGEAAVRRGVRAAGAGGKPSTMPTVHHHGVVVDHNHHHHHHHHDDHFQDMADFFDQSAQELSSIDHSAAAVDAYGYNSHHHQTGPNPYEQAKRQYLKKKQQQQQQQAQSQRENNGATAVVVEAQSPPSPTQRQFKVNEHHHHHHDAGHPHHFVSPMVVGLHHQHQLSSADQHTPQPKVVLGVGVPAAHHQHHGAAPPTSHFTTAMSGVINVDQHQTGLGRGSNLGASSMPHQDVSTRRQTTAAAQHINHHHHQLSVNRICAGGNAALQVGGTSGGGPDPFNMSANRGGAGNCAVNSQTNAFGNTPAGLMSNGQPCMATDAHRQHLSVSGWNLVDETESAAAVHHHHHHYRTETRWPYKNP